MIETTHGWFDVAEIGPGVWSIAEPGHVEQVHSYVIEGKRDVAVLDTGMGVGDFPALVSELSDRDPIVVQSHAHWDHVGATSAYERVIIHPSERADLERGVSNEYLLDWFRPEALLGVPFPSEFDLDSYSIPAAKASGELHDGQQIDLGDRLIDIHHTPGHSPGGITVYDSQSRLLFPADAVNYGPLYLFSDQADLAAYQRTLELLVTLAEKSDAIYPSHYQVPMVAEDIVATRAALNEIIGGRAADEVMEDREVYKFDRFVFWLRPGAIEELR